MASTHRYELRREWIESGGIVNFIMLNPSTADEVFDDPTIRKCCGFAKRWGYAGIVVTNLFAFRATDPKELKTVAPMLAIGTMNDEVIREYANMSAAVVCAWGDHGEHIERAARVLSLLRSLDLRCIGKTKRGNPTHPCRAPYTTAPQVYRAPALLR